MNKITLEIPDQLMNLIRDKSESIESILLKALEDYLAKESESLDITKTKTWELCGSLEIPNPEPELGNKFSEGVQYSVIATSDTILFKKYHYDC
jgi:hypothetical protein